MKNNIVSFWIQSSMNFEDRVALFRQIKDFLSGLECNYPFFEEWLDMVFREVVNGKRSIVVLMDKNLDIIVGLAILKNAMDEKKICTLRVANEYRNQGCGSYLIERAIEILKDNKPLITVSEEHVDEFKPLFHKYGFKIADRVKSVYNDNKYEYYFNKPYQKKYALMSIKPKYANAIMHGSKKVEFRRQIFDVNVERVYVYSSHPIKELIGYFEVDKIICENPDKLWDDYNKVGCISKKDFISYFNNCSYGFAIVIKGVHRFAKDYLIADIFGENFRVPQSYRYINNVKTQKLLLEL